MEKREVTSFINPRRDRTPLTKPVTKPVGESIYFLHSYLDFSVPQSAFAHSVNSHGVQDSLVALHMRIYRISVCSLKSSQMIHVGYKLYGRQWSFRCVCLFWSSYCILKHLKKLSHISKYIWGGYSYKRNPLRADCIRRCILNSKAQKEQK